MEGKIKKSAEKLYSFSAGFFSAAVVFGVFWISFNLALAAWTEPRSAPPGDNVPAPLNIGSDNQTKSGGLTIGGVATTSKLCFDSVGEDCRTTWENIAGTWQLDENGIYYDSGNVGVGAVPLDWVRLNINMGTANNIEGLHITRGAIAEPWSYLNIEDENGADGPVFVVNESGNVGIGVGTPSHALQIYDSDQNAEIDLQSASADGTYWGIYHDGVSDELRFWNGDTSGVGDDRVSFQNNGTVVAADFCVAGGGCLSGGVSTFSGLTASAYDGSQGGYVAMNDNCAADYAGSHVCSANEMLILARNPSVFTGVSGYGWINTGVAGFKDNFLVNDCQGWMSNSGTAYGSIWNFDDADTTGGSVWLSQCNATGQRKIACCQ